MSMSRKPSHRTSLAVVADNTRRNATVAASSPSVSTRRYSSYIHQEHSSIQRKRSSTTTTNTPRRSSLTALTASARAKVVTKQNLDEKTTADTTDSIRHHRRSSVTRRSSGRAPRSVTSNQPEPNLKACCTHQEQPQSKTVVDIDQLTALLLKTEMQRRHHDKDRADRQMLERAQRRQSMPPLQHGEGADDQGVDDEFWKELVEIKSRLQRLEINKQQAVDDKSSSSSTTTASSVRTPPSSMPSSPRLTVHQKRLQNASILLQQRQPGPLAKAMSSVVAETIAMNQKLWSSIPSNFNTDARSLVAMQKSSDLQLRQLTEALHLMASGPSPSYMVNPSYMVPAAQFPSALPVSPRRAAAPPPPSFDETYYYRRPTLTGFC